MDNKQQTHQSLPLESHRKTVSYPAKELVYTFCRFYKDRFGVQYNPSWGRDCKVFKGLSEKYSREDLVDMMGYYIDQTPETSEISPTGFLWRINTLTRLFKGVAKGINKNPNIERFK